MNKNKTPKQYVLEAFKQGNGEKIAKYLKKYWKLQEEEKRKKLLTAAKKIFS